MLAVPDPNTFEIVPWRGDDAPVARMFCDIQHLSGDPFDGDPRYVLKRNLDRAREKGFTFFAGPEMEFFYFESDDQPGAARPRRLLRPDPERHGERAAQADDPHARGDGHPGRVLVPRERPEPARDRPALHRRAHDGRQRHDVPPVVHQVAQDLGVHATFMPKPIAGAFGSGMHTHLSLFEGDVNAFHDPGDEYGLSKVGKYFIAGLLAPRRRDHRGHEPVGELLQAADRGLRGAGVHVLGAQQPVGARAGPAPEAGQGESHPHRVPLARPGVQPVPRVLGDARRRPPGHRGGLRPPARGHEQHLRDDGRGAPRPRASTSLPAVARATRST